MSSKLAYIFVCLGLVLSVVSCKKKHETDDIVVDKIVEKPQDGPIDMGKDQSQGVIKMADAEFTYVITRSADSSRVVTNYYKEYCDNNVTLTVKRSDGTQFFTKTFSKNNFSNVLPSEFVKSGVLTNMRFAGVEGKNMNFVVTVGSPDENNEDFFLVQMTLSKDGHTSSSEYQEPDRGE